MSFCSASLGIFYPKSAKNMTTVYLIDASPYIFRAYYSLPPTIKSPDGMQANAVYGYTDFLIPILKENPTHIAVAFDGSLTTSFRNKIYLLFFHTASSRIPKSANVFYLLPPIDVK